MTIYFCGASILWAIIVMLANKSERPRSSVEVVVALLWPLVALILLGAVCTITYQNITRENER